MALSSFEKFSGYYCSGSFVSSPSTLTALALLFEELYLPNNLELAIEFASNYVFKNFPDSLKVEAESLLLSPQDKTPSHDPFAQLTLNQQSVLKQYYTVTREFLIHYHELIGVFIKTNLVKDNEIFDVQLIKKGHAGKLNTYQVSVNPLEVTLSDEEDTYEDQSKFSSSVPVLGDTYSHAPQQAFSSTDINARSLACLLAMKSIEIVLPSTKPASGDDILEARYRLRDFLPPFWASMLKLSTEIKNRIDASSSFNNITFECDELVSTVVLPSLIELKDKIRQEEKTWFRKIVSPIANGVKLFIGNSQLSQEGLMRAGMLSMFGVIDNIQAQARNIEMLKQANGLAFLLETDKHFSK